MSKSLPDAGQKVQRDSAMQVQVPENFVPPTRHRVTVCIAQAGGSILEVDGEETAAKGVVIHPEVSTAVPSTHWVVTCQRLGIRIGWARTKRGAQLLAGAYGGLPIAWDKIPATDATKWRSSVVEVLHERLKDSPRVFEWLRTIQLTGAL